MAQDDRTLFRFLQFAPIWLALTVSRILPFDLRAALWAQLVGFAVPRVPQLRRRVARNLDLVNTDMAPAERRRFMTAVGRSVGRSWAELLNNDQLGARCKNLPIEGPGLAALERARADGKGAILVSGHYGQWEAFRHAMRGHSMTCGAVYKPNTNAYYNDLFLKNITMGGEPIFESGPGGVRGMLRHLRSGGFVAMLLDQRYGKGIDVDFLGQPAPTSPVIAEIALKLDLLVVPVYGLRSSDDPAQLTLFAEAPVPHGSVADMTQALTASLEARVHADPTQWYWLHNRWISGGAPGPDFVAVGGASPATRAP